MRLRNVKNKQEILGSSDYLVVNPSNYCGKWSAFFGNSHPIHIEVGMGKGNFIMEHALRYPDINFIGIEKYDSVLARAIPKMPKDLPNLAIICMDASDIHQVFSDEVECMYLNFSDPWPKKRHHIRRLTSPVFLKKYASIFCGDFHIIQKTDNRDLFEYSLLSYSQYGYILKDISLDYHHSLYEDIIMTEYEKKFLVQGKSIYYVEVVCHVSSELKKD
ncbi:MAG: tRNA (guanosine(46)-N7)-methyltransferase TrmB [bacterium]|nr:tRNA (guanosine(46)-N7)-methyltransferase TrmB [bacterium]